MSVCSPPIEIYNPWFLEQGFPFLRDLQSMTDIINYSTTNHCTKEKLSTFKFPCSQVRDGGDVGSLKLHAVLLSRGE